MSEEELSLGELTTEALMFIGVQLTRTNDILLELLKQENPVAALAILDMHKKGDTYSPPPFFKEGIFEDETD